MGLFYEGFEFDIKDLFKAIELRKWNCVDNEGSKSVGGKRLPNELKKLECSVNMIVKRVVVVWVWNVQGKGSHTVELIDLKLLTWNVRGLGNSDKRVAICKGLSGVFPDILVL